MDSYESSLEGDGTSEAEERSHTRNGRNKILSSSTKENIPPSTSTGKQSGPSTSTGRQSASDDQSELSKTNALLHTLLKRIERQDKKISEMQSKLSHSSTVSSASTESTPRRRSASDRRKEVPLEVRVSPQGYIVTCTYMYHMCNIYRGRLEEFTICLHRRKTFLGGN